MTTEPIGYAVRMADGAFVGIWQDRELAERICAKQPPGHGDRVIPVREASPTPPPTGCECYPGIAHDLETMRQRAETAEAKVAELAGVMHRTIPLLDLLIEIKRLAGARR